MIRTIIAAIALTVTALPAMAADFYLYGGASRHFAKAEFDDFNAEIEVDDAWGGGIAFGWDFAAGTALEILIDGASGEAENTSEEVASGAVSLNFYFAPRYGAIQPRIGVGISGAEPAVTGSLAPSIGQARGMTDIQAEASARYRQALQAVGIALSDVLVAVCLLDEPAGDWAQNKGLPRPDGPARLRLALDLLRDHYDGTMDCRGIGPRLDR